MTLDNRTDYDWFGWTGMSKYLSVHGICAVTAFASIVVVIFWYSDLTLSKLEKEYPTTYRQYKATYRAISVTMALSIVAAVILHFGNKDWPYILAVESVGIWAFAAYWFVKNREISLHVAPLMRNQRVTTPQNTDADIAEAI